MSDYNGLVIRLRKRAKIRRQIPSRKSVQNGEPDRIADLLDEAASLIEQLTVDDGCICRGNWRLIVKECEALAPKSFDTAGARFRDSKGDEFYFCGVVHGYEDYYYLLHGKAGMRLLSCVGNMETFGYIRMDTPESPDPPPPPRTL